MTDPARRGRPVRPPVAVAFADTNLFVALLVGPGHPLHETTLGIFRRVAAGELSLVIPSLIVAELVYVSSSILGWTRQVVSSRLIQLLSSDGLVVVEPAVIERALRLYGARARLDFADAYLAALALEIGPPVVASLDADLGSIDGVTRISA